MADFRGTLGPFRRRGDASNGAAAVADDPRALDHRLPDIDWRMLPPGAEPSEFAAPSGALARVALGPTAGPRIVLVPGATGSKEDFVRLMPLLLSVAFVQQMHSPSVLGHVQP